MQLYLEATVRLIAEKLGSPEKVKAWIESGEIKQTKSGVVYFQIKEK